MSATIISDTRTPIAVQLISNLVRIPIRAAATIVGSVADAVSSCTNSAEQWYATSQTTTASTTNRPAQGFSVNFNSSSGPIGRTGRPAKIIEGNESYIAFVEVSAVDPSDISVRVVQNAVEVSAKTTSNTNSQQFPSITIPDGVNQEGITADFSDGILSLHMPKDATRVVREVKVQAAPS